MIDRLGQQLGNYRLVRLLGRGGFAEVYLGEHLRLGTQAAIKVLHAQLADADDIDNFQQEAQTIASLIHPHIVRVLDFDVKNDVPFLVMDYAPNGSLRRQLPKGAPLPLPIILAYVKQISDALQYAHDQKLIHRDVKPENMLLSPKGEIWLSDFGMVAVAHSTHSLDTEKPGGTIPYMAPEQLRGKPRPASDQYALGVTVYEWLCGQRPFNGTATEIAMQHLLEPPPSLYGIISTTSLELEHVMMKALEKNPHERFASVQGFAIAFEQASQSAQSHSPILSQAPTTPDQPRQPTQKVSPVMPLSQQTIASPPSKALHTPSAVGSNVSTPTGGFRLRTTLIMSVIFAVLLIAFILILVLTIIHGAK